MKTIGRIFGILALIGMLLGFIPPTWMDELV